MVPSEAQKFNETSSGTDPIIKKTADANTRYKPISLSITSPKVQGFLGAIWRQIWRSVCGLPSFGALHWNGKPGRASRDQIQVNAYKTSGERDCTAVPQFWEDSRKIPQGTIFFNCSLLSQSKGQEIFGLFWTHTLCWSKLFEDLTDVIWRTDGTCFNAVCKTGQQGLSANKKPLHLFEDCSRARGTQAPLRRQGASPQQITRKRTHLTFVSRHELMIFLLKFWK